MLYEDKIFDIGVVHPADPAPRVDCPHA
jgi:hypothetical protein